jgi:hypothetical protein
VEVEARLEQAQALIGQLAHRLHGPNIENVLMYIHIIMDRNASYSCRTRSETTCLMWR